MLNFDMIVYNTKTKNIVSFTLDKDGEIRINSDDPLDTDENCIVTTWDKLSELNLKYKRGRNYIG